MVTGTTSASANHDIVILAWAIIPLGPRYRTVASACGRTVC